MGYIQDRKKEASISNEIFNIKSCNRDTTTRALRYLDSLTLYRNTDLATFYYAKVEELDSYAYNELRKLQAIDSLENGYEYKPKSGSTEQVPTDITTILDKLRKEK